METIREKLFIDELKTQINFTLFSIEEINIFLNNLENSQQVNDEKLEDFTSTNQNIILNKNIGPVANMLRVGNEPYDASTQKNLRHYDQYTKTFYFYGEKVNLEILYKEILKLKHTIENYG